MHSLQIEIHNPSFIGEYKLPYLLYLHGFNSSENAHKANLLKDYFQQLNLADALIIPRLNWQPEEAIKQLEAIIEPKLASGISLIGSSLGGFYANYLAHKYEINSIVLNPAIGAPRLIQAHLGAQTNYHTGERYNLTLDHIAQLSALDLPLTRPDLFWLILQKGDETLDYRKALDYYSNVKVSLEEGGSHSFEGFDRYLDDILAFAKVR